MYNLTNCYSDLNALMFNDFTETEINYTVLKLKSGKSLAFDT